MGWRRALERWSRVRFSTRTSRGILRGWPPQGLPLWSPDVPSPEGIPRVRANVVSRVVEWLRKGCPPDLPAQDFVPLIALLCRRLTDVQVAKRPPAPMTTHGVGNELVEQGAPGSACRPNYQVCTPGRATTNTCSDREHRDAGLLATLDAQQM